MSFPRYESYKDSGVEWLGEVPEHWEVVPFFSVAKERQESNKGMIEENLLSLSYGRIIQKDISLNDGLLPESFETYQIIREGDIVFRLTDLQNDKRSLRTAIVEETGIITSAYLAAMPISIEPRYLNHLLRAYDILKVFYSMGGGLRQSMKFSDVKRLPTLYPSHEEQQAIATFLDRETAKIDALIAEQQRLIELLKEKRQAVISHAVTKGLNPDAPMKDSGIEWLGEVPAHWEVKPIGFVSEYISYGFTNPMPTTDDGPYMLTANDIGDGIVLYDTARRTSHDAFNNLLTDKSRPRKNDILITKDGTLGRVATHDGQAACINQSVALLRVDMRVVTPQFLSICLRGGVFQDRMVFEAGGTTIKHIYISRLSKMPVLIPPIKEQYEVVEFLNLETTKFDSLVSETHRAIALLQERRTALISAAVTGKIDVRGLVSTALPEEAAA